MILGIGRMLSVNRTKGSVMNGTGVPGALAMLKKDAEGGSGVPLELGRTFPPPRGIVRIPQISHGSGRCRTYVPAAASSSPTPYVAAAGAQGGGMKGWRYDLF